MKIEKIEELIALSKALNYLKFNCLEYEAGHFFTSPIISDLLKSATENLQDFYRSKGLATVEWVDIESLPNYLKVIRHHIQNIDNWKLMDSDEKVAVCEVLISPYKFETKTVNDLIVFGDNYHGN